MKKSVFLLWLILVNLTLFNRNLRADEGMWLPALLDQLNISRMQELGMKITAKDIYDINQACLKDAVLVFGNGCTAEIVSPEGLLLTNHHCGLDNIQSHSSVEHDYLTNGFWAMSHGEELPNPGLTVTFLVRMEDVTSRMLESAGGEATAEQKKLSLQSRAARIEEEATAGTRYRASVRPLLHGNQFVLFVYNQYRDVRLVGAPPSAIGKFGGDTDNWIWPRHTGDFSIFRIYAGKDNEPADYSPENVPFKPKKFLPVSLRGVHENDFTMVLGYPGSTQQFMASYGVKLQVEQSMPDKIALRNLVLDVYDSEMRKSDKVRIQYTSKQAGISNAWKKWIGTIRGFERVDGLRKKEAFEERFVGWVNSDTAATRLYGDLLPAFQAIYTGQAPYLKAADYYQEAIMRIELLRFVAQFNALLSDQGIMANKEKKDRVIKNIENAADDFYKDYYLPIDRKLASMLVKEYINDVDPAFRPAILNEITKKYRGNYEAWAADLFKKSQFTNAVLIKQYLADFNAKTAAKLKKDPAWIFYSACAETYTKTVYPFIEKSNGQLAELYTRYVQALMQMDPSRRFYPDANFTMRVTYGKVSPYKPGDAVRYDWYTTLDGIIGKEDPAIEDYQVPERLKTIWKAKDFGPYGVDGTMPVCFIASNHTSGGNSGSPVLNANGELIGINFDRNWEGTMSDLLYDSSICRNISVDIRYVLFIIDKYAGAGHLLKEMTLVQ
ncbi:MAG: S46 family peptidase [Bacteroidales bacterium]